MLGQDDDPRNAEEEKKRSESAKAMTYSLILAAIKPSQYGNA